MSEDFVALLVIIGFPVAAWIISRALAHRERMAMLERGIIPPPRGLFRRRGAAAWTPPPQWGAQQPQTPPQWGPPLQYGYDPNSPQCILRKGITVSAVGIALFIGLSFIGYHSGDGLMPPTFHPGPWLLGGLIPMFVGFAQIAIAVLSGAQFGPPRDLPRTDIPPPSPGPFSGNGSSAQPGRPGPRYEELARPVPPPDRS